MNIATTILGIIGLVLLFLVGQHVYNTYIRSDWIATYEYSYSNFIGAQNGFKNKEACLSWIREAQFNPNQRSNFECGKNCEPPTTELGLYKCQETAD